MKSRWTFSRFYDLKSSQTRPPLITCTGGGHPPCATPSQRQELPGGQLCVSFYPLPGMAEGPALSESSGTPPTHSPSALQPGPCDLWSSADPPQRVPCLRPHFSRASPSLSSPPPHLVKRTSASYLRWKRRRAVLSSLVLSSSSLSLQGESCGTVRSGPGGLPPAEPAPRVGSLQPLRMGKATNR